MGNNKQITIMLPSANRMTGTFLFGVDARRRGPFPADKSAFNHKPSRELSQNCKLLPSARAASNLLAQMPPFC